MTNPLREVRAPTFGEGETAAQIVRWLATEGDFVRKGDVLFELETDKVSQDVVAEDDGIVDSIVVRVGEVAPDTIVGFLASLGDGAGAAAGNDRQGPLARPLLATPKARRLARETGVVIEGLVGSGPFGSILAADVMNARNQSPTTPTPPANAPRSGAEISTAWRAMAERMQRAWQEAPHFYLHRECDATRFSSWRDAARRPVDSDQLTHTDLLLMICAAALREHPGVNARWEDGTVIAAEQVNIGVAVATDDALVVPVVHDVDRLDLRGISARRKQIVERARGGNLTHDDVFGGTFTISNLGMFGVDSFQAIVNHPEAAILAVGRIAERVVVADGAPAVRPTLALTLSLDHRVVDGVAGARFLGTLADLIEEPAGLIR